jgi:regulator of protease activity HflC (stomatin/prohibitin superfamily)
MRVMTWRRRANRDPPPNLCAQCIRIPDQAVLTRDNANILVDSVLYYKVVDPYVSTVRLIRSSFFSFFFFGHASESLPAKANASTKQQQQ